MTQQKATDTLVMHISEMAEAISYIGKGLIKDPKPGLYRNRELTPTLVPSGRYYIRKLSGRMIEARNGLPAIPEICEYDHPWHETITSDVYDIDGVLRVRASAAAQYTTMPVINPVAVAAIMSIMDHVLNNHSNIYPAVFESRQDAVVAHSVQAVKDIWQYYTKSQDPDLVLVNKVTGERRIHKASANYDMIEDTINRILNTTLAAEEMFRAWLGDNHWNAVVINQRGDDLIIHRGQDYRITVWEAEHGTRFRKMASGKKIR